MLFPYEYREWNQEYTLRLQNLWWSAIPSVSNEVGRFDDEVSLGRDIYGSKTNYNYETLKGADDGRLQRSIAGRTFYSHL